MGLKWEHNLVHHLEESSHLESQVKPPSTDEHACFYVERVTKQDANITINTHNHHLTKGIYIFFISPLDLTIQVHVTSLFHWPPSDNYMQSNALLGPVNRIRAWILLSTYEYLGTRVRTISTRVLSRQ